MLSDPPILQDWKRLNFADIPARGSAQNSTSLAKTYPDGKQVLKNIYLSFFPGAKIGLNGSGRNHPRGAAVPVSYKCRSRRLSSNFARNR